MAIDIDNSDLIYKELEEFMYKNSNAKLLTRINDISDFMSKTTEDME